MSPLQKPLKREQISWIYLKDAIRQAITDKSGELMFDNQACEQVVFHRLTLSLNINIYQLLKHTVWISEIYIFLLTF